MNRLKPLRFLVAIAPRNDKGLVEEVLFKDFDTPRIMRGKESRCLAYERTNGGRYLFVVLAIANKKTRIITARDMTDKEKKLYRKKK